MEFNFINIGRVGFKDDIKEYSLVWFEYVVWELFVFSGFVEGLFLYLLYDNCYLLGIN